MPKQIRVQKQTKQVRRPAPIDRRSPSGKEHKN